jgi:PPOX class probable F420-dependent enzyme
LSRRDQIQMSSEEVDAFLEERRVVICATNGRDGWPHLMPLWFLVRSDDVWAWTYAKSQKVRNLERDPRATLQVEDGEQYQELRGVMIEAQTVLHRSLDVVSEFGAQLFERYGGGAAGGPEFLESIRAQAAKRVALQFVPQRIATWDHSKLGGVY